MHFLSWPAIHQRGFAHRSNLNKIGLIHIYIFCNYVFMYVCMHVYVCICTYVSVCMYVCIYLWVFIYLSINQFIYLVYLSVRPSVRLPSHPSFHLNVCLHVCLCVCLSAHQSVCLSKHIYIDTCIKANIQELLAIIFNEGTFSFVLT
jgi:hypothetical protein